MSIFFSTLMGSLIFYQPQLIHSVTYEHDIAVLTLERKVKFTTLVKPICVGDEQREVKAEDQVPTTQDVLWSPDQADFVRFLLLALVGLETVLGLITLQKT